MPRESAGLLPYRTRRNVLEVLLVHPGGPFWAKRDLGAWTIAKGEFLPDEDPLQAAIREFEEETGYRPSGDFRRLTTIKQTGGKIVHAWAVEMDWDAGSLASNTFAMEWPRGSGRQREFPEVDRAEWFAIDEALRRILQSQRPLLEELRARLDAP